MRLSLMLCQTLLLLALGCTGKPAADPIVIGLLAPLSGPAQDSGKSMEQGVLLAVEAVKENPLDGRPVEVLVVDTAGDAETAFQQAVRLVTINRVTALIGGHDAASAEKLCRVGETYQLPVLTLAWLPPRGLGPFGFSVGPPAADRGKALAKFGLADGERVAVLTDSSDPAAAVLSAAFVAQLKADDVVWQRLYDAAHRQAVAHEVRAANPPAVLLAGRPADFPWWRQELAMPLLIGNELGEENSGVICWTSAYVASEAAGREFAARFEKRFGRPPTAAAALAHDAARLWIESVRKAGRPQGAKVKDELAKWSDFPSVTGPLAIDADQSAHRPVFVIRQEKGVQKVLGAWAPK